MADFEKVLNDELGEIRTLRERRGVPAAEHVTDFSGLGFSGGGIRSATFSLGSGDLTRWLGVRKLALCSLGGL